MTEITLFILLRLELMTAKTSVIYRPFLLSEVKQDIDTMLYNATDILKAYNSSNKQKKDLDDYIKLKSTVEYIELLNTHKTGELKTIDTKGVSIDERGGMIIL